MSEIQTIRFDGDNLHTVREGEQVWVVVKRVCEALGIDANAQQQRLRDSERCAWATACVMHAVAEDGKNRELFCVDLDTLPMWLATIDVGRVKPEAREKLIAYQKECARVLRDHFFGRATPSIDHAALAQIVAAVVQVQFGAALDALAHAQIEHGRKLDWLMANVAAGGAITGEQHRNLQSEVRHIATLEVAIGRQANLRAARADLYREMGRIASWGGKGQLWSRLPVHMHQPVLAVLAARRKDAEKRVHARGVVQLDLAGTAKRRS